MQRDDRALRRRSAVVALLVAFPLAVTAGASDWDDDDEDWEDDDWEDEPEDDP